MEKENGFANILTGLLIGCKGDDIEIQMGKGSLIQLSGNTILDLNSDSRMVITDQPVAYND